MQINDINNIMIVSPHFDDAVISCAGLLCSQKNNNTKASVYNVFSEISQSKQPLSKVIVEYIAEDLFISKAKVDIQECLNWINARRHEEILVSRFLNFEIHNLGYVDAIFRCIDGQYVYKTEKELFSGRIEEISLINKLTNIFEGICQDYKTCYFPVGIGNHPDHLILNSVGVNICDVHSDVRFYYELPYSVNSDFQNNEIVKFDIIEYYEKKLEAIRVYKTQLNWLCRKRYNLENIIPKYEMYSK